MLFIFADVVKDSMEVFMDDFLVAGDMFDQCLGHFKRVL